MIAPERLVLRTAFTQCCIGEEWDKIDEVKQTALVRQMERNCFEVVINDCIQDGIDRIFTDKKFVDRYSAICSRVMSNIKLSSNTPDCIIRRLMNNELDPYKIAEYSSIELYPSATTDLRDNIQKRSEQKTPDKVSRAHTCYKCGENRTIYQGYQARSADEGESKSILCVGCGYVWRK